jgi:ATP-binding cassette, subfamily B, bacterial MsbA
MPHELKLILKDLLNHKPKLVIVAITGILMAAGQGMLSIVIKDMISAATKNPEKLGHIAILGILVIFIMNLSRYFHIFTMNVVSERVSQGLREKLQFKFINLDLKFHNKYISGSGGLLSRTFNDVKVIHDGLRLFADLFSAPLTFVFLVGVLFYHDWRMTSYIIVVAPILLFILRQTSKSIRKYSLMGMQQLEDITSTVKESLDGVRTIQSFSLQNILRNKLVRQGADFIFMRKKIHSRIEFMGPFTEFLAAFLILGIMFYFAERIRSGTSDEGVLMGFVTAMLQINLPIKKFQEAYVRVQETRVSALRVFGMLEESSALVEPDQPVPFPESWSQIEYRNITFAYEAEKPLLKNFSLTIKKGTSVAFVGESGSGKSTLANLLMRFYDPDHGEILIDKIDIRNFSLNELRNKMALVSQDVFLFSDSIEKNIQAGIPEFDFDRIRKSAQAAHALDFIEKMPDKFKTAVGERGNLLSGGEKQRVAIARAIYKDAPILILDEATSALDSVSEEKVQMGLQELVKGRTTFIIAHRLSTIQGADLILVLKNGRVVEQGTHKQLMDQGLEYFRLFQTQTNH